MLNLAIMRALSNDHSEVIKVLLADGRINIKIKIGAVSVIVKKFLREHRGLSPVFNIERIKYLARQNKRFS